MKRVIVSSHRPHEEKDIYAVNQLRAKEHWNRVFTDIYYFGPREPELEPAQGTEAKTHFVDYEQFPHVRAMAEFMSTQPGPFVTFSNADIVVTPDFLHVMDQAQAMGLDGGQSRRRDWATKDFLPNPGGYDIWFLRPEWWGKVAAEIPPEFRIGHHNWDTWILMFMREKSRPGIGDFTPVPCVYHPEHECRKLPYSKEIKLKTVVYHRVDMPINIR